MAAGLALGALWLWLALRGAEPGPILAAARRAEPLWVAATAAAGVAYMGLKAWRWALLLRPVAPVPLRLVHRAVWAGGAANLVVAHSGELLRAGLVGRGSPASTGAALASIAVERVFDFAALAVLSALAIGLDPRVSSRLVGIGGVGLAVVLIGLALVWRLARDRTGPEGSGPPRRRLPAWLAAQTRGWRDGLLGLISPRTAAASLALSLLQWLAIAAAVATSAAAVGLPVSAGAALAVFALMVLGLTLPSAPAQLGTTQLAFQIGLGLVGTPPEPALAASLIYTGWVVLPQLLMGGALALLGLRRPPAPRSPPAPG
jgi:uncharacterized membrane protein YbhN (UPF0104 family)